MPNHVISARLCLVEGRCTVAARARWRFQTEEGMCVVGRPTGCLRQGILLLNDKVDLVVQVLGDRSVPSAMTLEALSVDLRELPR